MRDIEQPLTGRENVNSLAHGPFTHGIVTLLGCVHPWIAALACVYLGARPMLDTRSKKPVRLTLVQELRRKLVPELELT